MRQLLFKAKALFTKKQRTQQEPAELGELFTELGPKQTFFKKKKKKNITKHGLPIQNKLYRLHAVSKAMSKCMLIAEVPC